MWVVQTPYFSDSSGRHSYSASLEDATLSPKKGFFLVCFSVFSTVAWAVATKTVRAGTAELRQRWVQWAAPDKQSRQVVKAAWEPRKKLLNSVSASRAGRRKSCGRKTERKLWMKKENAVESQGRETTVSALQSSWGAVKCLRPRVWTHRSRTITLALPSSKES